MSREITVAGIQTSYGTDIQENIDKTVVFIQQAAREGAQVILPSELFEGPYFCTTEDDRWFALAKSVTEHECVLQMQKLARDLGVAIPVSFFERDGDNYYNSLAMVDHEGKVMGVYRKSHIPCGPGYEEKYYFKPGDSGFKVWDTKFGKIGVGICWDQWFPECARSMALMGAEILMYPTAIGSEPHKPELDTAPRWRRAMQGHAVSNVIPVVAANRIGTEDGLGDPQTFYGTSFIADQSGEIVEELGRSEEGLVIHSFNLDEIAKEREVWCMHSDRRPDLYKMA